MKEGQVHIGTKTHLSGRFGQIERNTAVLPRQARDKYEGNREN
eukprot:COSAG06_NODE_43721_length_369_cov_1.148148_1_plen_42_part_01